MTKSKHLLFFFLAFNLAGSWNSFAVPGDPTEDQPISITIDPRYLNELSPERRKILEDLVDALKKQGIKGIQNHQIQLPSSALDPVDGQIVRLSSLFKDPSQTGNEPESLAYDENGKQKKLTAEQLTSLRNEGIFKIPSKEFPGQYHVWKINTLLQKGIKNIQISYEKDMGSALGHILIGIPADFLDGPTPHWSVEKGVKNIGLGVRQVISSIIGLVEEKPKYSSYEVENLIAAKKKALILQVFGQQSEFDLRLYDDELTMKLAPEITRIQQESDHAWQENSSTLRKKVRKELDELYPHADHDRISGLIEQKLAELALEELNRRLREDKQLESLSPGYGILLSNKNIAIRFAERIEQNLQDIVGAQEELIRSNLNLSHPILAKNEDWLNKHTTEETKAFYQEIRWDHFALIPLELDQMGLHQEAEIYKKLIQFQKESEENLRAEMAREKIPANEFEFQRRIWNSHNWIAKEVKNYDGSISFYPQKYSSSKVATDQAAWRVQVAAQDTASSFKNGLYRLVVTNLWNGPVGLKALFGKSPFISKNTMNAKTGQIEPDPSSKTSTYANNLSGIWKDAAQARKEFEETPDKGFLGKKYIRWFNKFWNYGVKGVGGSVAVGIGQPLLTVGNLGVSGALAITSPVWAPLSSLFKLGFSAVVYDFNSPAASSDQLGHPSHEWFPIPQYIVRDIAIAGAGQSAVKATQGIAYEPLAFVGKGLYAELRSLARQGYDGLMRKAILNQGSVPAVDSFGAKRIQGPGISSSYFYQIHPEIALLALQAVLESEEMRLFESNERNIIQKPMNEYYSFFATILQPVGTISVVEDETSKKLRTEQESQLEQLQKKVSEQNEKLSALSSLPYEISGSSIKLTAEELNKTLGVSEKVVQSFYEEHLKPRMDGKAVNQFWEGRDLEENDFKTLTRQYYSNIFDKEFMSPLEETDKSFIIDVKQESLKDIFSHFPI